jgi:TonB family protein
MAGALPEIFRPAPAADPHEAGLVRIQTQGIEPADARLVYILPVIWTAGSLVALIVLLAGCGRLAWLASRSRPLSGEPWSGIAAEISTSLGLRRRIHLAQTGDRTMPITWGLLRPRVLLPECAAEWSGHRRRIVLTHEFAHVRRLDFLFKIAAELACVVYWFNPLFWIARNRLDLESERACDDAVINSGIEGSDYATELLQIARSLKRNGPPGMPALAMARHFGLERRLIAILNAGARRRSSTLKTWTVVAIVTLAVALPLAALDAPSAARDVRTDLVIAPEVVEYTTPPLYSDEARDRGIEGIVLLEGVVGLDGRVRSLRVVKGIGFGLDENALVAVREWRFAPGARGGKLVEMTAAVSVEFDLRTAELNESIANDMATRVGPGVVPPRLIHRVDPEPAKRKNVSGPATVVLDTVIQEDGIPRVVRVVHSLGWGLDENAIAAVKQWRFSPATRNGLPVKVRMNVEMAFDSNGAGPALPGEKRGPHVHSTNP